MGSNMIFSFTKLPIASRVCFFPNPLNFNLFFMRVDIQLELHVCNYHSWWCLMWVDCYITPCHIGLTLCFTSLFSFILLFFQCERWVVFSWRYILWFSDSHLGHLVFVVTVLLIILDSLVTMHHQASFSFISTAMYHLPIFEIPKYLKQKLSPCIYFHYCSICLPQSYS